MNREVLLAPFQIYVAPDDPNFRVSIPAGDYTFTDYRIGIDSGDQRKIALRFSVTTGEYYDGEHSNMGSEVIWRPSPKLRFGVNYDAHEIDLPGGEFIVRQSTLRAELIFSSTLSWVNLIQYDNVSENLGSEQPPALDTAGGPRRLHRVEPQHDRPRPRRLVPARRRGPGRQVQLHVALLERAP